MPVEIIKVCHHDWHRQSDGENTGDDAQGTDQFAPYADRGDVAVAHGCHGNDRPPEGARYRGQLCFLFPCFGIVDGRTEDHHCHDKEEEKHALENWSVHVG